MAVRASKLADYKDIYVRSFDWFCRGREKNSVYSHKRSTAAPSRPHPQPEGIGFGGSEGKEKVWLDEEFKNLTLRHHAVDKTY